MFPANYIQLIATRTEQEVAEISTNPILMGGQNAVGISSALARIGSAIAPLLLAFPPLVSNLIFGGLAIIAAFASLAFPETKGREMMESIEEAEAFYGGDEESFNTMQMKQT